MSNKIIYRLELAIEKIDQIYEICKPKGVTKALMDELLAKPAIMKHLDVVQQQFEKFKNDKNEQNKKILEKFDPKDIKGLTDIRNKSSHDYDDISNEIIEDVIRTKLPKIKENLEKVLSEEKSKLYSDIQKKIDYFVKKQNILITQAKSKLVAEIQKSYNNLQKNGLELDKAYINKLNKIIKNNSVEREK